MKIDLKYSFSRDGGPQNIYKDQSRPEHWVQISGCWLNISNKADMTIATQISLNSTGIEISGSETLWLDPDRVSLVFRSLNCVHTDINTWRERHTLCVACHPPPLLHNMTAHHCAALTAHLWYLELCIVSTVWDPELQRNGNSNLEYIYICWKLWHVAVAISIWFKHFFGCIVFWCFFDFVFIAGILFSYGYTTLLSTVVTFYGSTIVIKVLF